MNQSVVLCLSNFKLYWRYVSKFMERVVYRCSEYQHIYVLSSARQCKERRSGGKYTQFDTIVFVGGEYERNDVQLRDKINLTFTSVKRIRNFIDGVVEKNTILDTAYGLYLGNVESVNIFVFFYICFG